VNDADVIAFTADLTSWGSGVRLGYMPNARFSACMFAGTKVTSWAQNLTWYETAHQRGLDEFILLNEHGQVSECTSANIFAVQGNQVQTPPLAASGCLPGVTRAILLEEVNIPGIEILEADLIPGVLEESDQVFVCSSTRELLPVIDIEGQPLKQKPQILVDLQQAFRQIVREYVMTHPSRNREPLAV
jgi:branched-subunit amino acid aminotransferase/4-amino-4-deoxychorismate lyase